MRDDPATLEFSGIHNQRTTHPAYSAADAGGKPGISFVWLSVVPWAGSPDAALGVAAQTHNHRLGSIVSRKGMQIHKGTCNSLGCQQLARSTKPFDPKAN